MTSTRHFAIVRSECFSNKAFLAAQDFEVAIVGAIEIMASTYYEGTILRAFYYPGTSFKTSLFFDHEELAQQHCDSDPNCVGYWQRISKEYRCLYPGGKSWTWSAGLPNETVISVKVKGSRANPSYQVQQMLT